jgi:hypothetical protein
MARKADVNPERDEIAVKEPISERTKTPEWRLAVSAAILWSVAVPLIALLSGDLRNWAIDAELAARCNEWDSICRGYHLATRSTTDLMLTGLGPLFLKWIGLPDVALLLSVAFWRDVRRLAAAGTKRYIQWIKNG